MFIKIYSKRIYNYIISRYVKIKSLSGITNNETGLKIFKLRKNTERSARKTFYKNYIYFPSASLAYDENLKLEFIIHFFEHNSI